MFELQVDSCKDLVVIEVVGDAEAHGVCIVWGWCVFGEGDGDGLEGETVHCYWSHFACYRSQCFCYCYEVSGCDASAIYIDRGSQAIPPPALI
jgi:hypothetical protein